ncbi:hypothetical protein PHYBOEH_007933 [Phytophthora boehmeriae]|uniref:Uncharacterized protein n=1 Tax=Phytophthora boehmeriae TaxID=109152 RepID=A0A8T1X8H0_9STRA|nr:hypothetical protein PHYBOEH_007933 [Phytophthora boehmeriae]
MMTSPAKQRPKRVARFLEAHEVIYGVRALERCPETSAVTSVACLFCAAFGREDDPHPDQRKRARTRKYKYWGGPCFRTDNYKSHMVQQHPQRWSEYQKLSSEARRSYFQGVETPPQPAKDTPVKKMATVAATQSQTKKDDGQVLVTPAATAIVPVVAPSVGASPASSFLSSLSNQVDERLRE